MSQKMYLGPMKRKKRGLEIETVDKKPLMEPAKYSQKQITKADRCAVREQIKRRCWISYHKVNMKWKCCHRLHSTRCVLVFESLNENKCLLFWKFWYHDNNNNIKNFVIRKHSAARPAFV